MNASTAPKRTESASSSVLSNTRRNILLAGCFFALLVSSGPIIVFSYGVFLKSITAEFSISRSSATLGLLGAQFAVAAFIPVAGRMIDIFGVKRVLVPSVIIFSLAVASIGLFAVGPVSFFALYLLVGIASAGHSPTAYAKVVASWFSSHRGLALGIAMAAIGVGGGVIPPVTEALIAHVGWRNAYVVLGLVVLLISLPAVLFAIREPRSLAAGDAPPTGVPSRLIWRSRDFWLMAAIFGFMGFAANGTLTQVIPMLTDRGIAAADAARVLGTAGLALIVGRVVTGLLLDHMSSRIVTLGVILAMIVGVWLLASGQGATAMMLGPILLGLGLGAEVDLLSYMVAHRFGMRCFGAGHGGLVAVFAAASGIGPLAMSISFDRTGDYTFGLGVIAGALIVSALLTSRLSCRKFEDDLEQTPSYPVSKKRAIR